jgi:predicted nucleic acid-binding protein
MSAQPILLDTCALIWILKGSPIGQAIIEAHQLDSRPDKPMVSVVSVGELLALVRDWKWGAERIAKMQDLLREYHVLPIDHGAIKDKYGELMGFSKEKGLSPGQNDHWIAATASVAGARIITTDKDFDGLHAHRLMDRDYHDPEEILAAAKGIDPRPKRPSRKKK